MMTRLTNDILDLAKIKAGMFNVNHSSFRVQELIEEIMFIFESQCSYKQISFEINCDQSSREAQFNSDKGRISQILLNFLSNSLKFTSEGGIDIEIKIGRSTMTSKTLFFRILDTGDGMTKEEMGKLFQIFGKVSNEKNNNKNSRGTGLGMFIAKQLIDQLGGEVHVESEKGKGTCIYFSITEKNMSPSSSIGNTLQKPVNQYFRRSFRQSFENSFGLSSTKYLHNNGQNTITRSPKMIFGRDFAQSRKTIENPILGLSKGLMKPKNIMNHGH